MTIRSPDPTATTTIGRPSARSPGSHRAEQDHRGYVQQVEVHVPGLQRADRVGQPLDRAVAHRAGVAQPAEQDPRDEVALPGAPGPPTPQRTAIPDFSDARYAMDIVLPRSGL
jgi:hypothetical protein